MPLTANVTAIETPIAAPLRQIPCDISIPPFLANIECDKGNIG
jgi:hypothetical protein